MTWAGKRRNPPETGNEHRDYGKSLWKKFNSSWNLKDKKSSVDKIYESAFQIKQTIWENKLKDTKAYKK